MISVVKEDEMEQKQKIKKKLLNYLTHYLIYIHKNQKKKIYFMHAFEIMNENKKFLLKKIILFFFIRFIKK